jgi:hypothetical protein
MEAPNLGDGPVVDVMFVHEPAENFHVSPNGALIGKLSMPPKRIAYPSATSYAIDAKSLDEGRVVVVMLVQTPVLYVQVSLLPIPLLYPSAPPNSTTY